MVRVAADAAVDHRQADDVEAELQAWRARLQQSSASPYGLSCGAYVVAPGLLEASGRVLRHRVRFGITEPPLGGRRGDIEAWSKASRRRLRVALQRIEWQRHGEAWVVLTLTLPGADTQICMDGREVKRYLDRFLQRWRRAHGVTPYVWKLEFQSRGAAHYAIAVPVSLETARDKAAFSTLQAWVARSWWEVVGSGSATHLRAGTQTALIRDVGRMARYMSGEFIKGKQSKEYQHRVPGDYTNVGRWWYVSPALLTPWSQWEQDEASAYATRRVLVRLARANNYGRYAERQRHKRVSCLDVFTRSNALLMGWQLHGMRT